MHLRGSEAASVAGSARGALRGGDSLHTPLATSCAARRRGAAAAVFVCA